MTCTFRRIFEEALIPLIGRGMRKIVENAINAKTAVDRFQNSCPRMSIVACGFSDAYPLGERVPRVRLYLFADLSVQSKLAGWSAAALGEKTREIGRVGKAEAACSRTACGSHHVGVCRREGHGCSAARGTCDSGGRSCRGARAAGGARGAGGGA